MKHWARCCLLCCWCWRQWYWYYQWSICCNCKNSWDRELVACI